MKSEERPPYHERIRQECRRPISDSEIPYLVQLGRLLRELRTAAGLSQARLAKQAQLSSWTIGVLEHGSRRTRRSTLERIARALVKADSALGDPEELTERLAAAGGPAIASESAYRDRVERRRSRRKRKGRYGPRTVTPLPGESFRNFQRRLAATGARPAPGVPFPMGSSPWELGS